MTSRRKFFIRFTGALLGNLAVGSALAAACTWVIEAAALSFFLSFLLWLITIVATLALSQYVVHPLANAVLSDRKLDDAVHAMGLLARELGRFGQGVGTPPWDVMQRNFNRFASGFAKR